MDPAAHTPRPPSESPTARSPSPGSARHRSPPAPPAPPPASSDNEPAGWLFDSAPGRSAGGLQRLPPPLPASALLAPQTADGYIYSWGIPSQWHSTPLASAAARSRSAAAAERSFPQGSPLPPPARPGNDPASARSSLPQTGHCCTPTTPPRLPLSPSAKASDQTWLFLGPPSSSSSSGPPALSLPAECSAGRIAPETAECD